MIETREALLAQIEALTMQIKNNDLATLSSQKMVALVTLAKCWTDAYIALITTLAVKK